MAEGNFTRATASQPALAAMAPAGFGRGMKAVCFNALKAFQAAQGAALGAKKGPAAFGQLSSSIPKFKLIPK